MPVESPVRNPHSPGRCAWRGGGAGAAGGRARGRPTYGINVGICSANARGQEPANNADTAALIVINGELSPRHSMGWDRVAVIIRCEGLAGPARSLESRHGPTQYGHSTV